MGILRADRITGLGGANAITGSVRFHGNQDDLQLHPSSDFNFGTGDYTIEAWVYPVEFGRSQMIFAVHNADSTVAAGKFYLRSSNKFTYWSQNAAQIVSSGTYTESKWYHVALVNNSGTQTIYVDGTSQGTATYSGGFGNTTFVVHIGRNAANDNQSMNGYISNIRVTKGTALYTSAFTPPTTRLTKRSDTVLLACNSASNVLNEETGKVIQSVTASTNNSGPQASKFTPNSPVVGTTSGFSTTTDVGSQYGSTFDGFGSFASSTYMVPPGGNTRERNRGRALYAGGYKTPNTVTTIDSVEIQSGGTSEQFGDLSGTAQANCSACSSSTRMVTNGGWTGSANNNVMEFVTIANSSNSTDFGDLAVGRRNNISASNQTRGLVYGGNGSPANTAQVDFFTIATTGNAADFGDASSSTALMPGAGSSTTRALFAGGYTPSASDAIDYFTIASTGNYSDFGNLVSARKNIGGLSSSTRTLFGGGGYPSAVNSIDYVTTATTGNAQDFGDLTLARGIAHGTSNQSRGIFMGGSTNPARQNTIDFVIIAVGSDAIDFGDLRTEKQNGGVASDSHGGL